MSLVLTIVAVIGVVVLVMFVVIPGAGADSAFAWKDNTGICTEAQHFLEELFTDNSEIRAWLNNLDVDLDKLLDSVIAFFRNGAGNVLNSTVYAIGSIVNGVTTFVIAFVFACYILLQKEKLGVQVKKVMHAFLKEKWEKRCLKVCTLTSKTFSNFLTGQCLEALILGRCFLWR